MTVANGEEVNNLLNRRTHRKKKLTYSRNVNSIDSALDETNYHMIEPERKRITGYSPSKHSNQKKKKQTKLKFIFQIIHHKMSVVKALKM